MRRGLRRGMRTSWILFRVMIPTFIAVDLLARLGVIEVIGRFCAPVMGLFRLPGESAIPVLLGLFINVVAATAALGALGLSSGQILTLGLMIGIGHSIVVETAVTKAAGARAGRLLLYGIILSIVVGLVASRILVGAVS